MTTREIQGHLQEIYGVEVSPSLISEITDAVIEELAALGLDCGPRRPISQPNMAKKRRSKDFILYPSGLAGIPIAYLLSNAFS